MKRQRRYFPYVPLHGLFFAMLGGVLLAGARGSAETVPDRTGSVARYRVTEIPLPSPLADRERLVINADGDVAGTQVQDTRTGNRYVAFYYHKGIVTDLALDGGETHAIALNRRGQVLVGRAVVSEGGVRAPQLWERGRFTEVGPLPTVIPGWRLPFGGEGQVAYSAGCALDDAGQMLGYFVGDLRGSASAPVARTFRWKPGTLTLLTQEKPPPTDFTQSTECRFIPATVNQRGEIVGSDRFGDGRLGTGPFAAVVWKRGKTREITVHRPASASMGHADGLRPYGMNARGQWVGAHEVKWGTYQACLWSGEMNAVRDLAEVPVRLSGEGSEGVPRRSSVAYGINDKGLIVGTVVASVEGQHDTARAALWQKSRGWNLNDLLDNAPGVVLEEADGINAAGQIVAIGHWTAPSKASGARAFLLTPVRP